MLKNTINCLFTRDSNNGIIKSDVIGFLNLMHQFIPADTTIFNNIKDSYNTFEEMSELYEYINNYIKDVANRYSTTSKVKLNEKFDDYYANSCGFIIEPKDHDKAYSFVAIAFSYDDEKVKIKIEIYMVNPEIDRSSIDLFIPSGKNRNLSISCTDTSSYNDPSILTLIKGNISFNEIYKYMTTLNDYKLSALSVIINTKY